MKNNMQVNPKTPLPREKKRQLSVYYTAGYPELDSTLPVATSLQAAGVDFLEIGFPYSDPIADGPVIQQSSMTALQNGMNLEVLFRQLEALRPQVHIPVYLMGYINPVLQYGVENFCRSCQKVGINGVIIPDLPLYEYETLYQPLFEKYGIHFVFLITPHTEAKRIRKIDQLSNAFIYVLSSPSITGNALSLNDRTTDYFKRIQEMNLKNPTIVGFGIGDHHTFQQATNYADGAIVGTAFVKILGKKNPLENTAGFISSIRGTRSAASEQ